MVIAHAPFTGILLGTSIYYSSAVIRGYPIAQSTRALLGWSGGGKHFPLLTFPLGPLGVSLFDVGCALFILWQMRKLERRWGSASYLTFIITTSLVSSFLTNMFIGETSTPLPTEQLQFVTGAASIMPLVTLVTRFITEVPSLQMLDAGSGSTPGLERPFLVLSLLKVVVYPDTELLLRTSRVRGNVLHVDVGLFVRLMLALVGVVFGLLSRRPGALSSLLSFLSRRLVRPALRLLRPIVHFVGGPTPAVELRQLKLPRRARPASDGHYTVDNLVGGDFVHDDQGFGELGVRDRAHRREAQFRRRLGGQRHQPVLAGEQQFPRGDGAVVTDELIAQVMELGMGFSVEDVQLALLAAGGRVDVAVNMLVGG